MSGVCVPESSGVGQATLATSVDGVRPGRPLTLDLSWTLPPPREWRELATLEVRLRAGETVVAGVRWDEAGNRLALLDPASGAYGESASPSRRGRLRARGVRLLLAESRAGTEGAAGSAVALRLALKLKPPRNVRELAAQQVEPAVATLLVLRK